jgi:hypothetical protein
MNSNIDEPEESSNICFNLRSSLHNLESEPSSSHHYPVAMLMDEDSSVCDGNWRTDCLISPHCKKENNNGLENYQYVKMKRRYLRRSRTSINTNITNNKCNSNSNFNNRPRISLRPSLGTIILFLVAVGLPSIVQAQNSTIAPSPSNIPSIPSPTPIDSSIESQAADDEQPILEEPLTFAVVTGPPSSIAETDNNLIDVQTQNPTEYPSTTMRPSGIPSDLPSYNPSVSVSPSVSASASPTDQATLEEPSEKENKFRQSFTVGNGKEFNDFEITVFETIYRGNTVQFAPDGEAEKVTTNCTIFRQQIKSEEDGDGESGGGRRSMQLQQLRSNTNKNTSLLLERENGNFINSNGSLPQQLRGQRHRHLQEVEEEATSAPAPVPSGVVIDVDFIMKYDSKFYNVTDYPRLFQNWTNQNLLTIQNQMNVLNLNVTNVGKASRIVVSTPAPSMSPVPSATPTGKPTITPYPSTLPPSPGSFIPTSLPSPLQATENSNPDNKRSNSAIIIVVSVIIALSIVAIGVLIYCKKRRQTREMELQADAVNKSSKHGHRSSDAHTEGGWGGAAAAAATAKARNDNAGGGESSGETKAYGSAFAKHLDGPSGLDGAVGVVVSPNGSLVSNQSLLSRGNSMGGDSKDEADTTQIFADEFDQYKDQNLEKMRADVEGNLEGCDGMMSQAVARALIEEDDITVVSDVLWGGKDNVTGPEIEASALGIIMDWLKRNDKATAREK